MPYATEYPPQVHEIGGYVTADRAAELLGLTRGGVQYLVLARKLKAVRLGSHSLLVERKSIERRIKLVAELEGLGA